MTTYKCFAKALDEHGAEFHKFRPVIVEAETPSAAWHLAKDAVWDDRLTCASCTISIDVIALEDEDDISI